MSYAWACLSNGSVVFGSLHLHLSCPRLKAGFFAIFCCPSSDVLWHMSCFGHFFQRHSSSKGTGTSLSLSIFRNSTVFNHMLFLVMFHIDSSLFTWSMLLSHLTPPSALYVRKVSVPMLSPRLSCHPSARVALWDMQGSMFVHGVQQIFLLGGQVSPPSCCWPSCLPAMGLSPLGRSSILFPRHPFCHVLAGFSSWV